jgi:hypothetical protein
MGLDMYLYKRTYIGANYQHHNITGKIELYNNNKPIVIDFNRVAYIEESVGYWRKANAIHKWFVENVQAGKDDCKDYYVDRENLLALKNVCLKILQNLIKNSIINSNGNIEYKNVKLANKLLPPQQGFFFGGKDIDEYYVNDLSNTVELIDKILQEETGDFYYSSSW